MALKKCKECGKEISSDAKKCPNCGKDQISAGQVITAILGIIMLIVLYNLFFSDSSDKSSTSNNQSTTNTTTQQQPKAAPMVVTADKLLTELDSNALNASNIYKGKYVELTGVLSNIDSSGKYFSLEPINVNYSIFTSIMCYITEEQKNTVANFKKEQQVTVTGTITDVGEVVGYSLKVETIK